MNEAIINVIVLCDENLNEKIFLDQEKAKVNFMRKSIERLEEIEEIERIWKASSSHKTFLMEDAK